MLKKIWQRSSYVVLSACLFLPALVCAEVVPAQPAPSSDAKEAPADDGFPKDSPWRKLNIFAQLTGVWKKPSKRMDIKNKSSLPGLLWHSEQGASLKLSMSPKSPLGSAQAFSVDISSEFFSCSGESLRLWFTTQQYLDLTKPVCDKNDFLHQQVSPSDEKKLASILNKGGFPVLLSQENSAVVLRSQLAPKEVNDVKWYRTISNPAFNKELMGEGK